MSNKNYWLRGLLALTMIWACSNAHAALKTLSGHVPKVIAQLKASGHLPATNRLDLAIGLPLRNQAALTSFLHDLHDPASTNFHHYLTPEEFTAQFGPTKEDYQRVADFAKANGLTVTHTHGNRVLLDVNGKATDVERAFHVTLQTYRHPTEARNFYAPNVEPSLDAGLPVLDVSGLSDFAQPKSMLHEQPLNSMVEAAAGSGPGNTYIGKDFRNAYVPGTSLDGSGQMVGLVQFSGYDPNDIFAYESQAGLPNVPLQNVLIDGYSGDASSQEAEVCLDIEMTISMATNLSAVVLFEAPSGTAFWNDMLNTMVASNQIKQLSSSWGFSGSPSLTMDQIFLQMDAQGQSFFQASGDGDAWTHPIWVPSENPNITIVGGTTLTTVSSGGDYSSEQVWNSGNLGQSWGANGTTNNYWGSGGGVGANYTIPFWQTNIDMTTNLGSSTMRNIPDVALTANNVYATHGSGTHGTFAGTSCAAPLWAGYMALVNQQAAAMNRPSAGFINPAVYALANSTNYPVCFHDITAGNNTWPGSPNLYFAVPGYDLCTGLGTPAGTNLINALAGLPDMLVITPLSGFVANGAVGGPFSGTTRTFVLTNSGAGPVNWSLINTSAWLAASSSSGTLAAGSQTNVTLNLTAAANFLPAGSYNAVVFFTNQTTQVAQPRAFTLRVGQSLVQDGGFETGTFSYWNLFGGTITNMAHGPFIYDAPETPHPGYNPVHSGNYGAFLGDSQLAVLYQGLPTYPGQEYLLSFWLINPTGGAGQIFEVNWNTNGTVTNTIYTLSNPGVFGWTNVNFVLAATGTNTTLQFGAANPPNLFGLDDISVIPIPSPSFSAVANASNGLSFTWNTLPPVKYIIQYKTNLLQANWVNLGSAVTATSNTFSLLDTNSFNTSPQRFYRISISP